MCVRLAFIFAAGPEFIWLLGLAFGNNTMQDFGLNSLHFADPRLLSFLCRLLAAAATCTGRVRYLALVGQSVFGLALGAPSTKPSLFGALSWTRSRGVVEIIWTWAWPSSPGRLPGAPGAARPTVAGDRDVVFDVDSTLISMMTEAVGVATRCCIWAGPLSRNV